MHCMHQKVTMKHYLYGRPASPLPPTHCNSHNFASPINTYCKLMREHGSVKSGFTQEFLLWLQIICEMFKNIIINPSPRNAY